MLLYNCTRVDGHKGNIPLSKEDGATIPMASSLKGTKTAADKSEQIEPEAVGDCTWCIEYHVPWALFAKHHNVAVPEPGTQWRCNFCTVPSICLRLHASDARQGGTLIAQCVGWRMQISVLTRPHTHTGVAGLRLARHARTSIALLTSRS